MLSSSIQKKNIKVEEAIILFADLYGCGTWFLNPREEDIFRYLKVGCRKEYLELRDRK
jgi:hypothetical protein